VGDVRAGASGEQAALARLGERWRYHGVMVSMSLNEVQQDFGKAATLSQKEPVLVESEKVPVAVILSVSEFERLREVQFDEFFRFCDATGAQAAERGMTEKGLGRDSGG
jgi:hypothetical protein